MSLISVWFGPSDSIECQPFFDAVSSWLSLSQGVTLKCKIREVRRFSFFLNRRRISPLKFTKNDALSYLAYLSGPPDSDIAANRRFVVSGRQNPLWRPFTGPLSRASRYQSFSIVSSLYKAAKSCGAIASDPWASIKFTPSLYTNTHITFPAAYGDKFPALSRAFLDQWVPEDLKNVGVRSARAKVLFYLLFLCQIPIDYLKDARFSSFVLHERKWSIVLSSVNFSLPEGKLHPCVYELLSHLNLGYLTPSPLGHDYVFFILRRRSQPLSREAMLKEANFVFSEFRCFVENQFQGGLSVALS